MQKKKKMKAKMECVLIKHSSEDTDARNGTPWVPDLHLDRIREFVRVAASVRMTNSFIERFTFVSFA